MRGADARDSRGARGAGDALVQPAAALAPKGESHRASRNYATWPSALTENPYRRPELANDLGQPCDICVPKGMLSGELPFFDLVGVSSRHSRSRTLVQGLDDRLRIGVPDEFL